MFTLYFGWRIVAVGISTAITWWIAGIPWDFVHCVVNFTVMFILYKPVSRAMKWLIRNTA